MAATASTHYAVGLCWEYRCGGCASGSRCDGKGYAASSDTNTYHYPGCGGESHAGDSAGHSCQVDYAPTTSGAAAMATALAMAPVIALAPASSKAEAISLATVDMEDAATEEASPITPPHPLVELGTRAPGTPGSAFRVVEPWTDPDDISQRSSASTSIAEEEAVSEAATAMSAEEVATAMSAEDTAPATAMIAEDAAAATAMPAEDAAAATAMSAEDAAVATAIPAEDVAFATAMPAEDAVAVGVSAVSATVDTIIDGIDLRDL